ncbi:AAA family ATPase [Streptomonospora nanhaiensis]|uniref:helix-turn-helix transcriptional regulator n=1 Tax=Streptomonospora nanhaiensis TaxID=1323731 RepID=UPI001C38050B|nr:AAA family ATPase [Streptomonospora nanhaiensis]MBV2362357.1 AAA family ATPase [Streptomonospora nanhaiensis]MBX9391154.1 AAA family ATPase [Streptomonospora nanhaiensis]
MIPTPVGSRSVFVGRRQELRLLLDHAHAARSGPAATLLFGGEAGVGKSRLLAEFADHLPDGRVLTGGCLELGVDGLPFAPFVTVLRQVLRDHGRGVFDALAPGGSQELARLLPELGTPPDDRREARGLLFEQVLRLLTAVAGAEGVTVIIEDLHWADSATRDLLVFLLRNLDTAPVQIVATYRSDDLHRGHPLRRLLLELERLPTVLRHELAPLTCQETAQVAAAVRGSELSPDEAAALFERTGGNPLFVESLAAQGQFVGGDIPDRPRELLLASLEGLDDTARHVLRVASVGAVSAAQIEHDLLAHVAEVPEDTLNTALRALIDANVLRVDGTGYTFRHALLREAVHDELLPGQHTRLHLHFAEALDALPGVVPFHRLAAEQAHHYFYGHDLPRALSAAWWAAVRAADTLAFAEELQMLERVLEYWDRVPDAVERVQGNSHVRVVARAAAAALESGDFFRARALCDSGLAEIPADAADEASLTDRAVLLRRRGQARTQIRDGDGIGDLITAMATHPPHVPGYGFVLSLLAREAMLHQQDLTLSREGAERLRAMGHETLSATALATEAIRCSNEGDDRCAEADALITLGTSLLNEGDFGEGRTVLERGLALARELGDPSLETRGMANLAHYLREHGDHEEALALLDTAMARLRDIGLMSASGPFVALNIAEARLDMGDLAGCREQVRRSLSWSPSPAHRVYLATADVRAAVAQGDIEGARRSAALIDPRTCTSGSTRIHTVQLSVAAMLDLRLGEQDLAGALELSREVLERVVLTKSPGYGWVVLDRIAEGVRRAALAGAQASAGAAGIAAMVASAAAELRRVGPVQEAFAATVAARLTAAEGSASGEDTEAAWESAVRGWERLLMPLHRAEAMVLGAEAALAADRGAAVGDRLREAAKVAAECGAAPLAARARELARRAGVALEAGADGEPVPAGPPAGLTPREAEVLRLLGRGYTNAQIAEELFISAKTASVHVSHILAKLELPNRAAAGARAAAMGLV